MSPPEPSTLDVLTAIAALRRELSTLRDEWRSPTAEQLSVAAEPVKLADDDVRMELSQMMESIGRAKVEIAAIKHPMAQGDRLGKASQQLDAIVTATESATNDILRACEQIESAVAEYAESRTEDGEMASLAEDIGGQIVEIMEACSFQNLPDGG